VVALKPLALEAVKLPTVLADDRSALFELLVDAEERRGDAAAARRFVTEWLGFLEAEAAHAPDPAARAVFDAHRALAARRMGQPERALRALEQSERDFPADYNPPMRLCTLYDELRRFDDAAAACRRAIERADPLIKLRVSDVLCGVYEHRGDPTGAHRIAAEALRAAEAVPAGQRDRRYDGFVAALRKREATSKK
jgi:tetratricopeptide (TPR) repeat protein